MKRFSYLFFIVLVSLGGSLLVACGEMPTPTLAPTATPAPTITPLPTATTAPTPTPEPTTTPTAIPATSVAPTKRPVVTPTPARITPPTIAVQAENWPTNPVRPIAKGSFVLATNNGLFVTNRAGQDLRKLAAGTFSDPVIAPDGSKVVAQRTDMLSRRTDLLLVDVAGKQQVLTPDNGGRFISAVWSPDSKCLALTRVADSNGDGVTDEFDSGMLILLDTSNGKQQIITEGAFPVWSPDGVRLAFIVPGNSSSEIDPTTRQPRRDSNGIGVYNLTNQGKRTLIEAKKVELSLKEAAFEPITATAKLSVRYFKSVVWHPDSKHITVSADVSGQNGQRGGVVATLTIEEETPRLITAGGDAAGRVEWSPDGKRLAFETRQQYPVTARSANQIGLLPSAEPTKLVPLKTLLGNPANRLEASRPRWLDSNTLVYLEGENGTLAISNLENTNPQRLFSGLTGFDFLRS